MVSMSTSLHTCIILATYFPSFRALNTVRSDLSAFGSASVDFSLVLDPEFVQLDHLLAQSLRVCDRRRFSLDEFSQQMLVKVGIVENLVVDFYLGVFLSLSHRFAFRNFLVVRLG